MTCSGAFIPPPGPAAADDVKFLSTEFFLSPNPPRLPPALPGLRSLFLACVLIPSCPPSLVAPLTYLTAHTVKRQEECLRLCVVSRSVGQRASFPPSFVSHSLHLHQHALMKMIHDGRRTGDYIFPHVVFGSPLCSSFTQERLVRVDFWRRAGSFTHKLQQNRYGSVNGLSNSSRLLL